MGWWKVVRKSDRACVAVADSGLAGHELMNAMNGEDRDDFECVPVRVRW